MDKSGRFFTRAAGALALGILVLGIVEKVSAQAGTPVPFPVPVPKAKAKPFRGFMPSPPTGFSGPLDNTGAGLPDPRTLFTAGQANGAAGANGQNGALGGNGATNSTIGFGGMYATIGGGQ